MVDGREGAVEPANLASSARETFKCLRRGHFVHNVPVHSARDQLPRDAVTEWTVVTTDLSMYMMVVPSSATWTTWLSNTYMQSACESAQATYRRDRHAGVKVRRKARQALTLSYRVRGPVCGRVPVSANAVCNRTGRASPCCLECCEESQKESRLIRRVDLSAENPTRPAALPPPRGRHPAFRSDILYTRSRT